VAQLFSLGLLAMLANLSVSSGADVWLYKIAHSNIIASASWQLLPSHISLAASSQFIKADQSSHRAELFASTRIFMSVIETVPNKSPEPTADGVVSSAIAAHAASRRWLSFLR
jgi:hypothetical protein